MSKIKIIEFGQQKKYVDDFLSFTDEVAQEKLLLQNKHLFSHYFTLHKLLAYDDDKVVGRLVLSLHHDQKENAYVGFFKSNNDKEVAAQLFATAEKIAKQNRYQKLVGPVNACWWLGYRLEVDGSYYPKLWQQAGFYQKAHYLTNTYHRANWFFNFFIKKFLSRLEKFTKVGYKIMMPTKAELKKLIPDFYQIVMTTYNDLPAFSKLTLTDYKKYWLTILEDWDTNLIRVAFYKNKMVGFVMAKENKQTVNSYTIYYMGVLPKHRGLGKALIAALLKKLYFQKAEFVGAFILDNRPTAFYAKPLIKKQIHYLLLEKEIV